MPLDITDLGGSARSFPSTIWSVIAEARDATHPDCRARLDQLVTRYWKPVYLAIRFGWRKSNEEAKDLAQDFFTALVEQKWLDGFAPERGSFRKYVHGALRHFLLNEQRYRDAARRGGGTAPISLEQASDDLHPMIDPAGGATPEQVLEQEWARAVLEQALALLVPRLKPAHLACFKDFHLTGGLDYSELSRRHGLPVAEIGQALYAARRAFATAVEEVVRESVTDESECRDELARLGALFGGKA